MTSEPAPPARAADLAARVDKLPWNGLHTTILVALGAGWLFDSLEVQLFGNAVGPLGEHFHASVFQQDAILAVWLSGILIGALSGGWLTDRFGRRRLFVLTLLWYAAFTMLTAERGSADGLGFFRGTARPDPAQVTGLLDEHPHLGVEPVLRELS
ncbi:MFS transporter, partial [Streptomyces sp. H10-C2]|uniref:MFS transporter n=1 Tax=unclassified Streptomyces TaxID=2593676 RepID=UPI0024BB144E